MSYKNNLTLFLTVFLFPLIVFAESSFEALEVSLNLPMTGPLGIYGKAIQEGIKMSLDEDAESGSLVKFKFDDNEGKPKSAVSVVKKQLLERPDIYVSGLKPQLMAIKDILGAYPRMPQFSYIFDVNVRPQGEANIFRTFLSFKHEPVIFVEYAKKLQAKRVAIVYVTLPSTDEEFLEIVKPKLKELGVEDVYIQAYNVDLLDFNSLALNVRKYNPDLLIVSGFVDNFISLFRRFYEQGLIKGKNVIAGYDLIDVVGQVRPEWIEGVHVAAPLFITKRQDDSDISNWYEDFRKQFKKEPTYTNAYAYDMTKVILATSRNRKLNPTRDLVQTIQEIDLKGITGPLRFDQEGSLPLSIERAVVREGRLIADSQ